MYEVHFFLDFELLGHLLFGFGFGYLVILGVTRGGNQTKIDRLRHDVEVRKEWFRMLAEQKKQQQKKKTVYRI